MKNRGLSCEANFKCQMNYNVLVIQYLNPLYKISHIFGKWFKVTKGANTGPRGL